MLVSVIIPYFKDERNIYSSVNSALKQSYNKIEIIIIDDENSKHSKYILSKIKNKKIKILKTRRNLGVAKARNLGISKSEGELIAFLDSDDQWKKNKILQQVKIIKKKQIDFCYTGYEANKKGRIIYKVKVPNIINYETLLKSNPICCSSSIIKKKILLKNKFRNLKTKEDYELWLRLAKKKFLFYGINKILTSYKVRENSLSNEHFNKIKNAFLIYYKFNNFSLITSVKHIFILYFNAFKKKYLK